MTSPIYISEIQLIYVREIEGINRKIGHFTSDIMLPVPEINEVFRLGKSRYRTLQIEKQYPTGNNEPVKIWVLCEEIDSA